MLENLPWIFSKFAPWILLKNRPRILSENYPVIYSKVFKRVLSENLPRSSLKLHQWSPAVCFYFCSWITSGILPKYSRDSFKYFVRYLILIHWRIQDFFQGFLQCFFFMAFILWIQQQFLQRFLQKCTQRLFQKLRPVFVYIYWSRNHFRISWILSRIPLKISARILSEIYSYAYTILFATCSRIHIDHIHACVYAR